MLSKRQDLDQRLYALSFFMGEPQGLDVMKMIVTAPEMVNYWPSILHQMSFHIASVSFIKNVELAGSRLT